MCERKEKTDLEKVTVLRFIFITLCVQGRCVLGFFDGCLPKMSKVNVYGE